MLAATDTQSSGYKHQPVCRFNKHYTALVLHTATRYPPVNNINQTSNTSLLPKLVIPSINLMKSIEPSDAITFGTTCQILIDFVLFERNSALMLHYETKTY